MLLALQGAQSIKETHFFILSHSAPETRTATPSHRKGSQDEGPLWLMKATEPPGSLLRNSLCTVHELEFLEEKGGRTK